MHLCVGTHHRARVNAGLLGRRRAVLPQLGGAGEIDIGVFRHDAGPTRTRRIGHGWPHNDAGRLRGGQLLLIARVAEKAQRAWTRRLQWRQPLNAQFGVSVQAATQGLNDFPQAKTHAKPAECSARLFGRRFC